MLSLSIISLLSLILMLLMIQNKKSINKESTHNCSRSKYFLYSFLFVTLTIFALLIVLNFKNSSSGIFSYFLIIPSILVLGVPYFLRAKLVFFSKTLNSYIIFSIILYMLNLMTVYYYSNFCSHAIACIPI